MASFATDTVSVGVSKLLIIGLGLAKSVIIARWLGPEQNGLIAGLVIYPSLFMSLGSLGVRQATTYFVGSEQYPPEAIKSSVIQIWVLSTVLSVASSFVLVRHLSSAGDSLLLVCLAVAPIPFALLNTYTSGIFLGNNRIKEFNRVNWLPHLFVFLSTAVCVAILLQGVQGAMLAALAGPFCLTVLLSRRENLFKFASLVVDWRLLKNMLSLGSIYALALLVLNLNYKLDIVLLDRLATPHELGIYSKGAHLMEYLWQVPALFSVIVFARSAAAKDNDRFSQKVCQLLRFSLVAVALLAVGLAVVAPLVVRGLFGDDFGASATVLRIMLPGVVLLTSLKVVNMDLAGRGKPWVSIYAMGPALIVNFALNILLIPSYGANGAAVASTISYAVGGMLAIALYSRAIKCNVWKILGPKWTDLHGVYHQVRRVARPA